MVYKAMAFIYTLKCNAECEICGFSCSPKRDEKMRIEDAKRYIREAKESGIRILGIAGGEPFLYLDEMFELGKYAVDNNLQVTFTTNCFWATNYNKTVDIMKNFQKIGINHMKVSCDEFHNKNIPYENVKNVLRAANEIGFKLVLGCTVLKNSEGLKGVLNNVGDYIRGFNMIEFACIPIGRAAESFSDDEFIYDDKIPVECRDGGLLTVMPDGKTYPCGSMCGIIDERLVGNANEESIGSLIKKATENKHNEFIYHCSVNPYYDNIKQNKLNIKVEDKFVDCCNACYKLFSNNDIDVLNKIVDDLY